ncbi:MAG: hypothetical protein AB1422_12520 [bacterium]
MAILEKEVSLEIKGLKEIIKNIEKKKVLFINSLHHPALHLCASIPVSLEYDGYQFITYTPDLDVYGCGESEYEAVEDIRMAIVDLYYDFKGERLSQDLQNIFDYLCSIIKEKDEQLVIVHRRDAEKKLKLWTRRRIPSRIFISASF